MTEETRPNDSTGDDESNDRSTEAGLERSRRGFLRATGVASGALALGPAVASAGGPGRGRGNRNRRPGPPRLAVDGNEIVTEDGETVTLRGVNIVDPKRADTTAEARGKTAVQMVDLLTDPSRGWHSAVIRIPVQPTDIGNHPSGEASEPIAFTQEQLDEYLETHLDPVVERCRERGVYAIVDYHRHWAGLPWGDAEAGTINQNLQDETVLFWETVAPRYADEDHVLYEMYNEPTQPGMWGHPEAEWGGAPNSPRRVWDLYLEFAQPIVDAIRDHADNVVLVGSPGWTQSPEGALVEPVQGENLAYTFHIYPGHESSQERNWEDATIGGQGVEGVYEEYPLFVTEFGWRDYDDDLLGGTTEEFGEPFMEWLESHESIHWTAWCGDVWWEPAMFEPAFDEDEGCADPPCEWHLLGRDAGSERDMGEYIRLALQQRGVPGNYERGNEGVGRDNAGRPPKRGKRKGQ